ncbi:LOW QUALITY PROTEIN: tyrosine-protein phosphatase non-receptor type 23 [Lagopus muta]|uniref:LOW QUALITY PROTEIN: tyrosine-protein phosphatase non-receptor type 23 n=1 Tax=Lagopus muta TaxID=64668 RepID=UPI00209E0B55|nr:LOW QUALITY PROTEIN: tyrosine-protein phosphatase non-receptor type 23 [Lagopus muta]
MEAVPRMPMIWLDLKEAGEFAFNAAVKKFVLKNYGENPENYNEELRKLEVLRQSAVNVPRDFEGCSTLRKYFGQLHYLQSRIPMGAEQEAAVPIAWTEIFSGKTVTHEDIKYEQACILYNLGALHSMLGAMDKRVSEEGMKVSCTHFQCAAGAFTYLRDHFPHSYSVDMSHQILNLNINLMLGQAQECLLEKSMLDNRKSFLVARISAQVVDYYKEACRALENSETASLLGKIQKDWKKLVQMKIYYFAAVAHLHMGKQAEEQQKFGERVIYFQSALDKLNEAIKLAKGQPETVQEALRFTMDVIGGKYNSAKKDNDFIYHEAVPALDTLQSVKGAPLVKALPVNPTDPAVTGPDIFAKLVPMAAHEASSLYSEEKAKLLRDVMAKIEAKNEVLDQFMDSMQLDPETVDNQDMYSHIPPILMEKCAALSVRPDTVKNLVQSMQVLSGVFTDVEASLKEIRDLLEEDEAQERKLQELLGKAQCHRAPRHHHPPQGLAEVSKECSKYMELNEKASFTNTELHKAMNLHIGNLRLLSGPLEQVRAALPSPTLSEDDKQVLQNLKRILGKVQEMRDQRMSLEQQLREMIQKDDITTSLVTTDRSEMKQPGRPPVPFAPAAWQLSPPGRVEVLHEDLMKKSQEGKDFYTDLEGKAAKLLEKARAACQAAEANRQQILEKEMKKHPPPRPTAPKPSLQKKPLELEAEGPEVGDLPPLASLALADLPEDLRSLPPDVLAAHLARLPPSTLAALALDPALPAGLRPPGPDLFAPRLASAPLQPGQPFARPRFPALPGHYGLPPAPAAGPAPFPHVSGAPVVPAQLLQPSAPQVSGPPPSSAPSSAPQLFPAASLLRGAVQPGPPLAQPGYAVPRLLPPALLPAARPPLRLPLLPTALANRGCPRPAPSDPRPCAAPPRLPGPAVPAGGAFVAPQRPGGPAASFPPYAQAGLQPPFGHSAPFPPAQPPAAFPPPADLPGSCLPGSPRCGPSSTSCPPGRTNCRPPGLPPHGGSLPFGTAVPGPPGQSGPMAQPMHGALQPVPGGSPALPFCPSPAPCHPAAPMRPPQPSPAPSPGPVLSQVQGPVVVPCPLVPSPAPSPQPPVQPQPLVPGAVPHRPPPSLTPAPGTAETAFQRQSSSTDDLLSSSPESQHGGSKAAVGQPLLQPTKADAKEGQKPKAVQLIENDPYEKPERVLRLRAELERFRALLQRLEQTEPGGAAELDALWKELQDAQERDARQLSIAIARCYSMKNRHQDIMPYDRNRVVLRSGKDDYINASRVEDLSPYCPTIIATQAPLLGTAADFWLMIYEQKVSVVVMLVSEQELEKQKVLRYFPTERGQPVVQGPITLVLSSVKAAPTHVERMITLQYRDQSLKRTVIHLQFTSWPELGLPDSKASLLRFIQDVHGHYLHQRPLHTPIVVHCSSGVGRTGAFCLLYAAVQEVEAGNGIPELAQLVRRMRQQRKHMLQEKLHLKFCYEAVLQHAEQLLHRHGVGAPAVPKANSACPKLYFQQDPQDLVLGGDVPISSIQATIAKLSIKPPGGGEGGGCWGPEIAPVPNAAAVEAVPVPVLPDAVTDGGTGTDGGTAVDGVCTPNPELVPEPPGDTESSNHVEEIPLPAPPAPPAPTSSLELLASLTPEAFTLDASLKGKQRMNKQNFLQAQTGEGLRAPRPSDDPLSMLDPLWTLNKS